MMLTQKEAQAAFTAQALAIAGASDPATAAANAPELVTQLSRVTQGLARGPNVAPSNLFSLPIFPSQVIVSSGVVTPIAQTTFQWAENWHVIGVKCMVNETIADLSHVYLSLFDQRNQTIFFTSGPNQSAATGQVSFAVLMGSAWNPDNFYGVDWYVQQNLQWSYAVTSHDSSGSAVYTPEVVFMVEPWDPKLDPAPMQTR